MRDVGSFQAVYLHRDPVDMRRSLDGLSALVRNGMGRDFHEDALFVFVGRSRDRIKILYWARTGFALWYKRLERSRFPWPQGDEAVLALSPRQLGWLLEGIDIFRLRPHDSVEVAKNW